MLDMNDRSEARFQALEQLVQRMHNEAIGADPWQGPNFVKERRRQEEVTAGREAKIRNFKPRLRKLEASRAARGEWGRPGRGK